MFKPSSVSNFAVGEMRHEDPACRVRGRRDGPAHQLHNVDPGVSRSNSDVAVKGKAAGDPRFDRDPRGYESEVLRCK